MVESSLRACLSRTPSAMRTRTVPGIGKSTQPPQPLGEARPVGGAPLPDDPDGPAVRQRHGGVQGRRPVPVEPDGVGDAGDDGGEVIHDGEGVETLQQAAPPLGGEGKVAQQRLKGPVLLVCEPAQPRGGEVKPPCRGQRVCGVEHGGEVACGLQLLDGLVDRGPGPAGHGDHLLPVEEGHPRQGAEQIGLTSIGSHSRASCFVSSAAAPPLPSSPAAAGPVLRLLVCFSRFGSPSPS